MVRTRGRVRKQEVRNNKAFVVVRQNEPDFVRGRKRSAVISDNSSIIGKSSSGYQFDRAAELGYRT